PYSDNYRFALPNGFFQVIAAGLPLVRAPLSEIETTLWHRRGGVCLARLHATTPAGGILDCADDSGTFRAKAGALPQELRWGNRGNAAAAPGRRFVGPPRGNDEEQNMCGIAGVVSISGAPIPRLVASVEVLDRLIAHRGPDGHGVWIAASRQVGLAHRRLAII